MSASVPCLDVADAAVKTVHKRSIEELLEGINIADLKQYLQNVEANLQQDEMHFKNIRIGLPGYSLIVRGDQDERELFTRAHTCSHALLRICHCARAYHCILI